LDRVNSVTADSTKKKNENSSQYNKMVNYLIKKSWI